MSLCRYKHQDCVTVPVQEPRLCHCADYSRLRNRKQQVLYQTTGRHVAEDSCLLVNSYVKLGWRGTALHTVVFWVTASCGFIDVLREHAVPTARWLTREQLHIFRSTLVTSPGPLCAQMSPMKFALSSSTQLPATACPMPSQAKLSKLLPAVSSDSKPT
jgi:hypothetical protein